MVQKVLTAALPKPPLKNKGRFLLSAFSSFVLFAFLAVVIGGFAALSQLPDLLTDQALSDPAQRVEVQNGRVEGTCKTRYFVSDCDLTVRYTTQDNVRKQQKINLMVLGEIDDANEELEIYTLRDNPDKVGLTWGITRLTERWIAFGVILAIAGLFVWGAFFMPMRLLKQRSGFLAALADPKLVAVRVLGTAKANVNRAFKIEGPDGKEIKALLLSKKKEPLWLDEEKTMAAALLGPDGTYYLLREDGHPVELSAAEVDAVRQARTSQPA